MKKTVIFLFAIAVLLFVFGCSDAGSDINGTTDTVLNGGGETDENYIIVLLPDYQPNAKVTSLGGSKVKSVTLFADEAGTVEIGVYGKVESIPDFAISSAKYMSDGKEYQVTAGENKIELGLELLKYETVYISGSVKLSYSDNGMEFSTLGSVGDDIVLSDKKLSLEADVEYHGEAQVFEGDFKDMSGMEISYKTNVGKTEAAPFVYQDTDAFAGKKITKIRIPVKTVTSVEPIHSFTVYKIKKSVTSDFLNNYESEYKIDIDYVNLSGTEINSWYEADVSHLNIVLAEDETLAFASPGDTVSFAVSKTEKYPELKFVSNTGEAQRGCLMLDVYYQTVIDKSEKLEEIEALDSELECDVVLNKLIGGKKLSVLGDSVSTYVGYSAGEAADITNDTIRENFVEYNGTSHRLFSVDLTWWQKTANDTGMTVLVNNSFSGDHVLGGGQTRCEQLHDNTGDNAGENPDIIAILLGFNDINWSNATPEQLKDGYETMLNRIIAKYPDADIFLFTYYQYDFRGKVGSEESLTPYVNVIYELAEKYDCAVVDLFTDTGFRYDDYGAFSDDGIHPNPEGMAVVSEVFKDALFEKYCAE